MERLRFIDGDSHVLEPEAIWEDYLEKKYRHLINGHVRWVTAASGNGVNAVDESSTRDNALALRAGAGGDGYAAFGRSRYQRRHPQFPGPRP